MPTYEYECEKCGHRFELFQSMKEPPKRRCPRCRGRVRRLLGTGAGIVFKGSGFYTTDYRSESYKSDKKKESGDSPKAKPEPKPAPAEEKKKPKEP
jgi:putative FmdB family regulatory protein